MEITSDPSEYERRGVEMFSILRSMSFFYNIFLMFFLKVISDENMY